MPTKGNAVGSTGNKKGLGGFTLIEIMIVVAIIAILAAVALPSYNEHVRRSARTAAMTHLSDLAQRQELIFQNSRTYSPDTRDTNPASVLPPTPASVSTNYQPLLIACFNAAGAGIACGAPPPGPFSFSITISPLLASGQVMGEGVITLNSTGVRTWVDRYGNPPKPWDQR